MLTLLLSVPAQCAVGPHVAPVVLHLACFDLQRSANLAVTVCLRSPPTCFRLFACISSGCSLQPTALLVVSAACICATPRVAAGTCSYWSSVGRLPWQNALCCAVVRVVGALHLAQVWLMSWLQAPCSLWQLSCTLLEFGCSPCGRCPAPMPLCLTDAWLQAPCTFRLCVVVVFCPVVVVWCRY